MNKLINVFNIILLLSLLSGIVVYKRAGNGNDEKYFLNDIYNTSDSISKRRVLEVDNNINESASEDDYSEVKQVNIKPGKIKYKKIKILSKNKLLISWKKVKNADGYRIYLNDKKIKSIYKKKRVKYVIKGLKYGKKYNIKVFAVKNGYVNKNKGKNIVFKLKSKVKNGIKLYYNPDKSKCKNPGRIITFKAPYIIKVNLQRCVTTVYANEGKVIVPIRSFLCSPGAYTSTGTWNLSDKYRFRQLLYNSYSQWAVRIHDKILFHTTPYTSYGSNKTLDVNEYNKLGTNASHGCIRLCCKDMKWIYDNCDRSTKVIMYKDKKAGPFGKPELKKISSGHTWDPTDPTAKKYCKKNKCHKA